MNTTLAVLRRLLGMALLPLAVVAAALAACSGFFGASSLTDSLLLASCASLLLAFGFGSALGWKGFHLAGTPSAHHWGARIGFAVTAAIALLAALHLFKPPDLPPRFGTPGRHPLLVARHRLLHRPHAFPRLWRRACRVWKAAASTSTPTGSPGTT